MTDDPGDVDTSRPRPTRTGWEQEHYDDPPDYADSFVVAFEIPYDTDLDEPEPDDPDADTRPANREP
jgi:hypothetical protein